MLNEVITMIGHGARMIACSKSLKNIYSDKEAGGQDGLFI
jgi:hypothetical protein